MTQAQIKREIKKALNLLEKAKRSEDKDNQARGWDMYILASYPLSRRLGDVIERLENIVREEF